MQEYMEKQKQIEKEEKLLKAKEAKEKQKSKKEKSKNANQAGDDDLNPDNNELKSKENFIPQENENDVELENLNPTMPHNTKKTVNAEEPPKIVHIDTRVPKKRFWLPHWVIYIGYVLAFATVS